MSDPLRAFLSGKRTAKRHTLCETVVITGRAVQLLAETVDVSANGVQIRLPLQDALPGVTGAVEVAAFAWLHSAFEDGIQIAIPNARISVRADPVRTAVDADRGTHLLIGCRLRRDLTDDELLRLGLRPEACGPENPVSDAAPAELDAERIESGKPIPVRLHDAQGAELLFEGEVVALGAQSLTVLLRDAEPQDILTKLDCLELYFEVFQGKRSVWASRAVVTALPQPTEHGIELGLWSDTGPRRALVAPTRSSA